MIFAEVRAKTGTPASQGTLKVPHGVGMRIGAVRPPGAAAECHHAEQRLLEGNRSISADAAAASTHYTIGVHAPAPARITAHVHHPPTNFAW